MTIDKFRSIFFSSCVTLFAILFFLAGARIHQIFGTSAYDLGVFTQNFWLISSLSEPFNTVRGLHVFGDHFQPIQILLAPLYRAYPSVLMLLVLQVIAVSWGAVVLHRIALHNLPNQRLVALVVAVCYLLNPVVHNPLLWQYHTLVLALPLYLLWIEAYLSRNDTRFYLLLILLLLVREDVPATTLCFGLLALAQKRWRPGVITVVLSLGYWLFVLKLAMPYFNGEGYFRHQDGTVGTLLAHLFDVQYYVRRFWEDRDAIEYLAYIFLPLLLLSLRSPLWLLPAIPSLLANVLIGGYNTQIAYHYSVNALPFVFVAAIMSLRAALAAKPRLAPVFALGLLTAAIIAGSMGSSFPVRDVATNFATWKALRPIRESLAEYDANLGPKAGIAATDFLLPHLANRERIYLFPNPWRIHYWGIRGEQPHHPNTVDYIFLSPDDTWTQSVLLRYLQKEGYFETEYQDARVWVLRRLRPESSERAIAVTAALSYQSENIKGVVVGSPRLSPVFPHPPGGFSEAPFDPSDDSAPGDWQQANGGSGSLLEIDLQASPEYDFATRYVYLPISVDERRNVEVLLGSDDTLEVWFQGEKILDHLAPRPARLGDNRLSLHLRPGINHLYFRVDNLGGAWRLIVELKPNQH